MTAFATANGKALVAATLTLPRVGAWHGDLVVDDGSELSGDIHLSFGGLELSGVAIRSGVQQGSATTRIVGGAGGLATAMKPKGYANVPLSLPLSDILAAGGETLAINAGSDVTGLQLRHWAITQGTVAQALDILVRLGAVDAVWRVLPDGTVWVGKETWDAQDLQYEVLLDDPLHDLAILSLETLTLLPGRTFLGRKVSVVEHTLPKGAAARTVAMFEK
jgi:hypothetical protein